MANSTFVSPTYVASQLQLIWYMTEFDPVIVREFSTSIPKRSTALVNVILVTNSDALFIELSIVVLSSLIKEKAKVDIDDCIVFLEQVISLMEWLTLCNFG
ncbi:unnamed protein product [Rotaria magnacalcarata]|uniref:Uncharacterized protein n=2 Tax=Rotaria magnacalcarata TaxID=392030 RepID=A0A816CZ90_9BILA|nr:unnamed protein product [Rotaria magnacalcarata]